MNDDPEIASMSAVAAALGPLDAPTQARVLDWAIKRFSPGALIQAAGDDGEADNQQGEADVARGEFDSFVDLYDAAAPTDAADKLLVGAYWAQVVKGADSFRSRAINDELRQLGHPVGSVSKVFLRLQKHDPVLVRQTSKSSNSPQGRKTYKLTNAGIRAVEALIAR